MTAAAAPPEPGGRGAPASGRLFRRTSVLCGLGAAVAAGLLIVAFAYRDGHDALFSFDGRNFLNVARDLDGSNVGPGDEAYRYGRILYPALGWVLAFGQHGALPFTLPAVNAVAAGLVGGTAVELARRRGASIRRGLVVLLLPGLWFSTFVAVADTLALGLVLLAYLLATTQRRGPARVAFALAALTRETAALALVPLVWHEVRRRRWRQASWWAFAMVPLAAWWGWVWIRAGSLPAAADAHSRRDALRSVPLQGVVEARGGG